MNGCAGAGDPEWSNVIAYVPCVTDIADASGRATVATFNAPTVSTSPAGAPGGASCSLGEAQGGSVRGFSVTMPAALHAGNFTIEFWVYETAWAAENPGVGQILISSTVSTDDTNFPTFSSDTMDQHVFFGGGANTFLDTGSALDVWESYAVSRTAGTTYLFRNGSLLMSFVDAKDYPDTTFDVSHQFNGSYNAMAGSIAQIRVTLAGRYASDYTPCDAGFATSP